MMMTSALCLLLFFAGMAALSVLLVVNNRAPAPGGKPLSTPMLDLAPPAHSTGPWSDAPDSLAHACMPKVPATTGWLGVLISTPEKAGAYELITVVGVARVPADQAASLGKLTVTFESRSTGERTVVKPAFVGTLAAPVEGAKPVALERVTRAERVDAAVVGFFVPRTMLSGLPAAEYRVSAQVDFAYANEQRLALAPQFG